MVELEISSPYVGLRPFDEEDRDFFFGRERETRIISSNLMEEPLTVLYGPSGAGKSSVLQAGVVPTLKSFQSTAVVYFRAWQSESFEDELKAKIIEAISICEGKPAWDKDDELHEILAQAKCQIFLLLDQFEEFLLYHTSVQNGSGFDGSLARLINREDIRTKVLIGIREDGLAKLNQRFAIRIPDLLGNTLEVERLTVDSARDSIEKPLEVFNKTPAAQGLNFGIEPAVVEAILAQVREDRARTGETVGIGSTRSSRTLAQVETAYLQLVLKQLWRIERQQGSTILRLKTLNEIGGASEIVRNHVNSVMDNLESDSARDIAARIFLHLVTPSRTKIAQRTEDLIYFGEAPEQEVKVVLNRLADNQESRILRRLSTPEQYEVFHDVLTQHILEWRRSYHGEKELAKQRAEQEAEAARKQRELQQAQDLAEAQRLRADEQAFAAKKLRMMLIVVIFCLIMAAGAAVYGFIEERKAHRSAAEAEAYAKKAEAIEQKEKAELEELQAAIAASHGNKLLAEKLLLEAAASRKNADTATQQAEQQGAAALSAAQELIQAKADRDKSRAEVQSLQKALDDAQAQIKSLQKQLDDINKRLTSKADNIPLLPKSRDSKAQDKTDNNENNGPSSNTNVTPPNIPKSPIGTNIISAQINVTVLDDWNRSVGGLEQENFAIFEDKKQQRLLSFTTEDYPMSIAVLLDLSSTMNDVLPQIREGIIEFLKTANPQDEFLLIDSKDNSKTSVPFTRKVDDVMNVLSSIKPGKEPALCDSLFLMLKEMRTAKYAHKAALVVSDSVVDHGHKHTELTSLLRKSNIQISWVAIYDSAVSNTATGIPVMENSLPEMATESGGYGFLLTMKEKKQLADVLTKVGILIRNQYILEYKPTNQNADGKYRHVQVKLIPPKGLPHLNVVHRQGYYAPLGSQRVH